MSGGVDSSVAACLLKEQGYECVGVFMRVGAHQEEDHADCRLDPNRLAPAAPGDQPTAPDQHGAHSAPPPRRLKHGCCSATDAMDARAVAGKLGLPFYALNFRPDFEQIIRYFVDEYAQARTPNPCVMCNIHLKFGKLLRYADMMDAEFIATGHYARTIARENRTLLARARNVAKDQSYVLFGIARDDLSRCLFPLGEVTDKSEVRRMAALLGLRVHDKPDSQEICFVPGNDYARLLAERRPELLTPGEIRNRDGQVLGEHPGVANFTIGQRRGLRLAMGSPVYVTQLDAANNAVTIGPREDLFADGLDAERMNWFLDPPAAPARALIKIRHMHPPAAGAVQASEGAERAYAKFDEPQLAVTPGQAAVFYDDEVVIGGGWIRRSLPAAGESSSG